MVLIYISVTTSEIKHLFLWALAIFVCSVQKCESGFGTGQWVEAWTAVRHTLENA